MDKKEWNILIFIYALLSFSVEDSANVDRPLANTFSFHHRGRSRKKIEGGLMRPADRKAIRLGFWGILNLSEIAKKY